MNTKKIILASYLLFSSVGIFSSLPVSAAAPADCGFGDFETGIPGFGNKGESICNFVQGNAPFLRFMAAVINIVTAAIIIAGLIMIIVGAYLYMINGGDPGAMAKAKTFITPALIGIALALTAWIILNTISPQFASDLQEPILHINGN